MENVTSGRDLTALEKNDVSKALDALGFKIIHDKKSRIIGRIKNGLQLKRYSPKIGKVKELLVYDEHSLSEIAFRYVKLFQVNK